MVKRIELLFLALSFASWSYGQAPDWIDESKRNRAFPSDIYLRGFVAESKVQENEKVMNRLKDLAKSDLIESIQVSLQSKTELKEQETKGSFQQSFLFESTSFSEADIYGLETETFYEKKQKRGFAFAYVKKEKLISYFKSVIALGFTNNDKHFKNIESEIESKNLEGALTDAFAIGDELKSIHKAQSILQAIGIGDNAILKKDRYVDDKNKRTEALTKILNHDQFSAKNAATYFVGAINQSILDKKKARIFVKSLQFRDYTFSSGLATSLQQFFSTEFSKTENITLVQDSASADVLIKGTYDDSPEKVMITTSVKDKKNNIHKISASTSVKSLEADQIEFLPKEIEKVRSLKSLVLISDQKKIAVKCNQQVNIPYKIRTTVNSDKKAKAPVVPISFSMNGHKPLSVIQTTENGDATFNIVSVKSPVRFQKLIASVDLPALLNIDTLTSDYKKIKKEAVLPAVALNITVTGNILYCATKERNLGNDLTTPYLREGVKDALSKTGFEFTTDIAQADYVLKIDSNTRQGSSFDDLFFSYLDASVSLIDQSQKKEVFSSQYADIKGAGTNYEGAGIKAYATGVKKIEKDLTNYFMK